MQTWSERIAQMPPAFHRDRDELLALMRKDAILYESPTQPILSRDGSTARWMLNSLNVTLTPRGAELAGRCVLELLKGFEGRQIATLGLTAVPILNSVILQSNGRYHGLLVRQQRKAHGSLKLIEGPIDPDEPTILIDDSISSGTAMLQACDALRDAGIRVEGGVALVRFGWYGGFARMQEQGYRVEAVSDIWSDFIYHMPDEPIPIGNPTKIFLDVRWSRKRAPDGQHPSVLARSTMRAFLSGGVVARPPRTLDTTYPSGGGAWVSLRSLQNIHVRHARDGYWNFPGEQTLPAPDAVVWAALKTAASLPHDDAIALLDDSAIAVTFFSDMEACDVGGLDNDRYGIVVRSLERPGWMGGALPRMPGILNEWDQYQHARITNADLVSFEPHVVLRHDVVKAVEPGIDWQPTGVPPSDRPHPLAKADIGGCVAARARDLVLLRLCGRTSLTMPLDDALLPHNTDSLYVSIHIGGHLRGCYGAALTSLDADLRMLVEAGLSDARFAASAIDVPPSSIAVTVSLLHDRLDLGLHSVDDVVRRIRYGEHALMVTQGDRSAVYLPSVASRFSLSPHDFCQELLRKAGIDTPPFRWVRFECTTWLADDDGVRPVSGSFPPGDAPVDLPDLIERLAPLGIGYLLRHQKPDGTYLTRYEPLLNQLYEGIDLPRLAHAAWVMARAATAFDRAVGDVATRTTKFLLSLVEDRPDGAWIISDGEQRSVAEVALLLLALCDGSDDKRRRKWAPRLAAALWSRIDRHGCIATHPDIANVSDAYQDYFSGQVLLALATAVHAGVTPHDATQLARAFHFYRHRFRNKPQFGQVSWMAQACAALWRLDPDPAYAELAFEIADWILTYQNKTSGAFLNDHQADTPGYTTALYIEGLAAAAGLARASGDETRHRTYIDASRRGLRFLDGLIVQHRDASLLPDPAMAIGGLRRSARASEICIDFVQHYVAALIGVRDAC